MTATAIVLLAGLAGGYWWGKRQPHATTATADSAAPKEERRVLYWYDPMAPDQRFDRPGKSPLMDMPLQPRYADEEETSAIRIDSNLQQNVGIRTAVVDVGRLATQLQVPGTLAWDLHREVIVSTPVSAIVSRVYIKAPYEPVSRGQALATVLAPEWSSAIAEARALDQAQSPAARELRNAAQQRLRVLGVPGGHAGGNGLTLSAPQSGVVSEVLVREGQAAMPGTPLFRVNGLDTLWLEAAIPQSDSAGIVPGTRVSATVSAVPGESFAGEVEALLPQIDPANRTQRARIVLRNEGHRLVPGMFAELTLGGNEGPAVPLVPTEALIATGTDSRVIVLDADGRFQPVRVRTGRSSGGRIEVLAGLKGGERVVTSGQFLIDSEASLAGALERLQAPGVEATSPTALHENHKPTASASPRADAKAQPKPRPKAQAKPQPAKERKVLYWYDPMMPDRHFDQPGKSPYMDMQLVPKYEDEVPVEPEGMDGMDHESQEQHP